ncbi:transmembrane channel-like protein 5 [Coregonus clupeaformis]|uniref:transmembrane channel-like protein 5 n=1 Tax=Coregonus clupeaformis TaxID=59861 RepID=UPI001E1C83ED|nr:transmembrane channel-like protein 5 [Coregonus clupeaformis]
MGEQSGERAVCIRQDVACLVLLAVWLLSVCLATGACLAVYYLCQHNLQCVVASPSPEDVLTEAWSLLLPVGVCVLNTFISLLYAHTQRLERYDSEHTRLYVTVLRNAMLKVSILAVLCYYWLALVPSNVSVSADKWSPEDAQRI